MTDNLETKLEEKVEPVIEAPVLAQAPVEKLNEDLDVDVRNHTLAEIIWEDLCNVVINLYGVPTLLSKYIERIDIKSDTEVYFKATNRGVAIGLEDLFNNDFYMSPSGAKYKLTISNECLIVSLADQRYPDVVSGKAEYIDGAIAISTVQDTVSKDHPAAGPKPKVKSAGGCVAACNEESNTTEDVRRSFKQKKV